eukprot:TRINITY_DN1404_c0_g1_i1.p1 TRINITY_DN1404_c0_g1~~TRINITY_DN1404_c0_g1_i1.p1  ORF type:complete len:140 (+),score=55.35 TRINITY_DN1404_c0_g1_i1:288-707(+)
MPSDRETSAMDVEHENNNNNENAEMEDADENNNNGTIEEGGVKLRFRSYRPKDAALKKGVLPKPVAPNIEAGIDNKLKTLVSTPDDKMLLNLAPKKPTWDLKRDVEKKLEKLQRKTQQSIVKLATMALMENKDEDQSEE